jgi:hypothetical protein
MSENVFSGWMISKNSKIVKLRIISQNNEKLNIKELEPISMNTWLTKVRSKLPTKFKKFIWT